MRVGDLVRIADDTVGSRFYQRRQGLKGVIVRDIHPYRKFCAVKVFDVMWNNGTIEDLCSGDLKVINEDR